MKRSVNSKTGWIAAASAAVAVLVIVVVVLAVMASRNAVHVDAAPTVAEEVSPPAAVGVSEESELPPDFAAQVAEIMDEAVAEDAMGSTVGMISDSETGEVLWSNGQSEEVRPASTMKVLTGAAALLELDHRETVETTVVEGNTPGTIIIRGNGDPTMSVDGNGFYFGSATVTDLADQINAHYAENGGNVISVLVEKGPEDEEFHSTWTRDGMAEGYISPITLVGLDAGRTDPSYDGSPRTDEPDLAVAQELADLVGAARTGDIATADVPADAEPIAVVESAPLVTRVRQMADHSDNVLAEALGREVARVRGEPATFEGSSKAIVDVLREHDLLLENGAKPADASGLSVDNRLTAAQLHEVLSAAARPDGNPEIAPLLDSMPVAAVSGTLANRYNGTEGAGWVRAKTGTLDGTSTLAGVVVTDSGRVLTFALLSNEVDISAARTGADTALSELREL